MSKRRKGNKFKPDMHNPAGPVDKTSETRNIPGISDDTRVVYSEEHGSRD